jgi:hypothetical protein
MVREPGGKAQLAAAIVALLTYLLQKYLGLVPVEVELLAPLLAYGVAQVVAWLWARQQTTPVASPRLPVGTDVRLPDGTDGIVTPK